MSRFDNVLEGLNTEMTPPAPMATSLTPAFVPQIRYYGVDGGEPKHVAARSAILLGLLSLDFSDKTSWTPGNLETWIWTGFEMVAPGSVDQILTAGLARLTRVPLTSDEIKCLYDDYPDGAAPTIPASGIRPPLPHLPEWRQTDEALLVNSEVAGLLFGIYVFGVAKTPTAENFVAFTERRPKAVSNKAGIDDATLGLYRGILPVISKVKAFSGYFNMRPAIRQAMTKEVIRWINGAPTIAAEAVATNIKLWKGTGMTHLFMASDFAAQYGRQLQTIPQLLPELKALSTAYKKYAQSSDEWKEFSRVVNGDREQFGRSRDYQNLLILARDISARVDPKFKNYAAGQAESPFLARFEFVCSEHNPDAALRIYVPPRA